LPESLSGKLAGLVLILIEGEIDTAIPVFAQLGQLRIRQVGADGTGGIAESRLPQDSEIEQPFDQDHLTELADRFPSEQAAFGTRQKAMWEGSANAATIEVDDTILLLARKNYAATKSILALGTN
jgi:hypothetical protein